MTLAHKIYLWTLSIVATITFIVVLIAGYSFYNVHIDERFYHPDYGNLKPSGVYGHGYGIIGSLLMIIGVLIYSVRKRSRSLSRLGFLKHWLEFHIFLCTLGPMLVLFHTSFKFGGLVAISFWSMVAVFLSGIIGRFIYLQIPRSIEGRELSLNEVRSLKSGIATELINIHHLSSETLELINSSSKKRDENPHGNFIMGIFRHYIEDKRIISLVKTHLKTITIPKEDQKKLLQSVKNDISLNRRIARLTTMQNLFRYWHVAHLPFALVMLIIMLIHVTVTIVFGYRWIF